MAGRTQSGAVRLVAGAGQLPPSGRCAVRGPFGSWAFGVNPSAVPHEHTALTEEWLATEEGVVKLATGMQGTRATL